MVSRWNLLVRGMVSQPVDRVRGLLEHRALAVFMLGHFTVDMFGGLLPMLLAAMLTVGQWHERTEANCLLEATLHRMWTEVVTEDGSPALRRHRDAQWADRQ